ncbi:hypothetical protein GUJ93_ZPchr0006g42784 [Zizania palustris]|uniref:Cyclin-dependent kinase inhibitor n=1 Tax=Zizania palustris TaxID=103762 RepID=A0A8J5SVE6_ZIZPA|nr:hypothetical protein GUJ93_ZPchr0006g42784 [Zizania palustris]
MGKYMRKGKVSGEVAVMEVAGALLGVRTRSRTLALQRTSQKPPEKGEGDPGAEYLELRSRRLEKPHSPPPKEKEATRRAAAVRKPLPPPAPEEFEPEVEVSFGDNVLDLDAMERNTRETTPCSLIRSSETIDTPGSTTKPKNSMSSWRRMDTSVCRYIPSSLEMEEFFAAAEHQQHQAFRNKYGHDSFPFFHLHNQLTCFVLCSMI